ncbi:MAG: asparagine synthase (glutamine-hydrolyzing), partial [Bacteroidales bacterium]|nr:asparagine synthase (glutamine-hydrolyzing) [Bacteroidales bacterium]
MCGIAGIVNFNNQPAEEARIQQMMDVIKHRGPDDEGTYVHRNFGLGHVRLSILDLSSAGHQPMFSNDKRFCIVFNGEIYNYIELKEELKAKYNFVTRTDTEVILAAYQEWGSACLNRFNGDFSFVIYDHQTHEFFGARDRYGIKPFYYYKDNDKLIFASEIKSIIPLTPNKRRNNKLVFEYLVYNKTDQSNETFFEEIFKLPHGHYFTIKNNQFNIHRWYSLSEKVKNIALVQPEEYRQALLSSVRLRLRSDVPVGVSLSGGIDSSTIASLIIDDLGQKDLHTFSATYGKDKWADESNFIDEYQDRIKNMHFTQPDADDFFSDFKDFIYAQGEPVASIGPYAQYKVMQLAQKNVKVTLDGQGADEQLAGYHNFFGSYFRELLAQARWGTLAAEMAAYIKMHKSLYAIKYLGFYLLPSGFKKNVGSKLFGNINKTFFNETRSLSTIDKQLYDPKTLNESLLDHFEFKLEHLLKWDDLNSMRFSIESRVPFLDHNLVELTLSLKPGQKIYRGTTKYILRESVKDILPHKIYARVDKNPS